MAIGPPTVGPKPPDDLAAFVLDRRALADRSPAVRHEADAQAGRPRLKLAPDSLLARKAAGLAPALLDGPGEARLDRRCRLVDVMAIEAEPGLEPQRVARAEAHRPDALVGGE